MVVFGSEALGYWYISKPCFLLAAVSLFASVSSSASLVAAAAASSSSSLSCAFALCLNFTLLTAFMRWSYISCP